MYFTLILENETGEQVNLSATANQYMTSKIEGLNPPAGTISTSSYAGMNGSYLNNAFIENEMWSSLLPCVASALRNGGICCIMWSSRPDTSRSGTRRRTSMFMPRGM